MEIKKRKTRMYEPWGYQDQNNYQSTQIIAENDLDSFFSGVSYKREDNKIHFTNKDGNEVGSLNVNDFIKSDQIVEKAWYEDGKIYVKFTNGDLITIDVRELIDENEFKDGLVVNEGIVKVLIDPSSDSFLSVSEDGVKLSGVQDEIDRLDEKIDDEVERATAEEERIDAKLDQEIQDRIDDVDAEEARAKAAEQTLTTNLNNEVTRATQTEQQLNSRVDLVNDELDSEESAREAADLALNNKIDAEITRATSADTVLQEAINAEVSRAKAAEQALDERIDEIISGSTPIEKFDELIEKLGYTDNDTLVKNGEHEVAFGQYNISNTSDEPSGRTMFSVGIGTDNNNRSNAIEIRENGDVYMWVEGDFMNVNKLLGQIAHEVYDNDSTHNTHFFDGE